MAQIGRRKRGPTTPPDVREAIRGLAALGHSAQDIQDRLLKDSDLRRRVPQSLRTIQNIARGARTIATGGPWSLLDGDPEEARLALPVMREMNHPGRGGVLDWNLSKELVRWIARVRTADPEIPLREAFFQALRYLQTEGGVNPDPEAADKYLVLQLWQQKEVHR